MNERINEGGEKERKRGMGVEGKGMLFCPCELIPHQKRSFPTITSQYLFYIKKRRRRKKKNKQTKKNREGKL